VVRPLLSPGRGGEPAPGKEARYAHAEVIGGDGYHLLAAQGRAATPQWLWHVPAIEVLRRVGLQQFDFEDGRVRWPTAEDLAPAGQRINSPHDVEATFGNKRTTTWTGYKVHLAETCEPGEVHLFTDVQTTPADDAVVAVTAPIQAALLARGLLPGDHLLDSGYATSELLVGSLAEHGVRLVGPVHPDASWQARADQGFDIGHFAVDREAGRVRCPFLGSHLDSNEIVS
jgi:transposase